MHDWLPPTEAKVVWVPPSEARVAERAETIDQHLEERPDPRVRSPQAEVASAVSPLALGEAITSLLWARPVQGADDTSGRPHWCRPRRAPGLSGRRWR